VRPTALITVPRFFEKTYAAIWERVNAGPRWRKKLFLAALKSERGTIGGFLAEWFVFRTVRRAFGGRLRICVSGGAHLELSVVKFFHKIGIVVLDGYGLTETSPVITVNGERDFKLGTVGKVIAGVEVRIAPDKEILVRGLNLMKGYAEEDGNAAQPVDADGWFHTGDMGFMDDDGFLTIVGRKKELIVTSGGKNVWPGAIESRLNQERAVRQSMVIGDGRKFIAALIVPEVEAGLPAEEPALRAEIARAVAEAILSVNKELSEHERIKKFILVPNEFTIAAGELTPTLKLARRTIAERHREDIEALYAA